MMRWNSFGRSVGFAALAAAGAAVWLLGSSPLLGGRGALALYLVGVTAIYTAGLTPSLRRALATAMLVGTSGAGLAVMAPGLRELAIGLAVVLGVSRSGFLYRTTAARAVVTEGALIVGGLLFAYSLSGPSLRAIVLCVWSFFLVQSLFFLVPGARHRTQDATRGDAFAAAHARALALLERGFV